MFSFGAPANSPAVGNTAQLRTNSPVAAPTAPATATAAGSTATAFGGFGGGAGGFSFGQPAVAPSASSITPAALGTSGATATGFPAFGKPAVTTAAATGFSFGATPATSTPSALPAFGAATAGSAAPASTFSLSAAAALKPPGGFGLSALGQASANPPLQLQQQATASVALKSKYEELPDAYKAELKVIAQIIKEHTHVSESLNVQEVGDMIQGLSAETDRLRKTHGTIATLLDKDTTTIHALKIAVRKEINRVEVAGRILDAEKKGTGMQLMQNKHYSTTAYFEDKEQEFQMRAAEYAQRLSEFDDHVRSLAQSQPPSPQTIADTVRSQHSSFLLLASQVAALHGGMDKLREQYLVYRRQYHGDLKNPFGRSKKRQIAKENDDEYVSWKEYANQFIEPTAATNAAPASMSMSTASTLPAARTSTFGGGFGVPTTGAAPPTGLGLGLTSAATAPPASSVLGPASAPISGGFSFGASAATQQDSNKRPALSRGLF